MWMESKRGKLFRSSNWTGGNININIRRKSKSSVRLASPEIGQGCIEVLRAGKLLQEVCERFHEDSETIAQVNKKITEVGIENQAKKLFKILKKRFTIELIIVVPDLDNKMRMEVDVLDYAIGGVLTIVCSNG